MDETYKYLINLLNDDDKIVVGISGGPDSIFLFYLLLKISKKVKINIIVAHVNHNLREQSIHEYEYVKKLSESNNVKFEYMKIDNYEQGNVEKQARDKRYNFFDEVINKYNADYLMTAHHGDDLIETILMRISRGSNLRGYSGFRLETIKKNYKIVRPLLFLNKSEIQRYLDDNNISYYIDQTNNTDEHTRNRYRKYVLPFLYNENANVHKQYLNYSQELQEYDDYMSEIVKKKISSIYMKNTIQLQPLKSEDRFIIKKIVEYILKDIYKDNINIINKKHIENILKLIYSQKPNSCINLPLNISLVKEYSLIRIINSNIATDNYEYIFDKQVILPNGDEISIVKNTTSFSNYYLCINTNEVKLPLIIRSRRPGDKIEVKNLKGSKKVKDILIDEKVPLIKRQCCPIVTDSNDNILWIPGIKKSKFDKKSQNYDIILRYQQKEGNIGE